MTEDEVSALLRKTGEYHQFILNSISSRQIELKKVDLDLLKDIGAYLEVIDRLQAQHPHFKVHNYRTINSTCTTCLKGLDSIAQDYNISTEQ